MPIQSFRELMVWQMGMDFVEAVYALTRDFPLEERYGLTAQLRRAATSIPSNVSEGHQCGTREYHRYVTVAIGSLAEAGTLIELARRLKIADANRLAPVMALVANLRPLLHGLRRSLSRRLRLKAT